VFALWDFGSEFCEKTLKDCEGMKEFLKWMFLKVNFSIFIWEMDYGGGKNRRRGVLFVFPTGYVGFVEVPQVIC
jgi:hypothetical protein